VKEAIEKAANSVLLQKEALLRVENAVKEIESLKIQIRDQEDYIRILKERVINMSERMLIQVKNLNLRRKLRYPT